MSFNPWVTRVCHTFPEPPFLFRTESEDSAVLMSQHYLFLSEFRRILSQHTIVDSISRSTLCTVFYTVQQGSSLLAAQGTQVLQILFTRGHDTSTQVRRARSPDMLLDDLT